MSRHVSLFALCLLSLSPLIAQAGDRGGAPSVPAAPESADALALQAGARLAEGALAEAARLAEAAIALDASAARFDARRVLVEARLLQGDLQAAEGALGAASLVPELSEADAGWARRADNRLACMAAEGAGELDAAAELLAQAREQVVEDLERAWVEAEGRRIALRAAELAGDRERLLAAQDDTRLSPEERAWVEGALLRALARDAEARCELEDAESRLLRLSGLQRAWAADLRWAELEQARLQALSALSRGRWGATRRQIEALDAREDLRAAERAGVEALRAALAAAEAGLPVGSEAGVAACWLPRQASRPAAWAQLGAVVGGGGWGQRALEVDGAPTASERFPDLLEVGPVLGLTASGAWPIVAGLGLAGEASGGAQVLSTPFFDGWAGVAWLGPGWWAAAGGGLRSLRGYAAELAYDDGSPLPEQRALQLGPHGRVAGGWSRGDWRLSGSVGWGPDVLPIAVAGDRAVGPARVGVEARGVLGSLRLWSGPARDPLRQGAADLWLGATLGMAWGGGR